MLCPLCQSIEFGSSPLHHDNEDNFHVRDVDRGKEYAVYQHHPSIQALHDAANAGCHLCCQIWEELLHIRGHERDDEYHKGPIEIRYYPKMDTGGKLLPPMDLIVVAKTPIRNVKILFDLVQYSDPLTSLLAEKSFNNDQSTGCKENFKLAMTWLSQCLSCHELCTISTNPSSPLPSRILDVQAYGISGSLRLCFGDGRYGPYSTLSHVWGKAQVITTTLATIQARLTSIEIKDLSRTFQDAVVLSRNMNVRYLWIDSLCIIQDSPEDWAKQSSKMGEYYMNSLFNISAVSASDGSEGCFMTRNPLKTTPCQVNIRFPGVTEDTYRTTFVRSSSSWDPVSQIAAFQRPPLWQRAWVVQERLLSARLLQFSSMQLSWKCRTMVASESIPEGVHDSYMSQGDKVLREALVRLKNFDMTVENPRIFGSPITLSYGTPEELTELYDSWYDLITLYGKCTLTKDSDIFPAISGIARAIATATGDMYVAGLWENDLHRGLLWSAPDSTSSKFDLRNYRAPSWSWASLKATCNFYVREISQARLKVDKSHFIVNAIVVSGSKMNPYGEIMRAELRITGLLKQAHPRGNDEEMTFKSIPDSHDRYSLVDLQEQRAVGFYFADNLDRRFLTQVWCCPVMTEEEIIQLNSTSLVTRVRPRSKEARCIALLRLNMTESIYMRVGNAWIKDFSWFSNCKPTQFSVV